MEFQEIWHLAISIAVLTLVFAFQGVDKLDVMIHLLPILFVAMIFTFVFHELAHRYVARHYGFVAEYRMYPFGLLLAAVIALATNGWLKFAAPGAVMIHPKIDLWGRSRQMNMKIQGIIALSGPLVNIIIGALALVWTFFTSAWNEYAMAVASINIVLALFNLIPFPPLDGQKIFSWNKIIWIAMIAVTAGMLFFV